MKFQLNFKTTTGVYAVNLASFELGLEAYDKAKISIPSLNSNDFLFHVERHFELDRNIHVAVPLEIAKRSGHFTKVSSIEVTIPGNGLNSFFSPVLEVQHWEKPGRRGIIYHPRKTKSKRRCEDYQNGDEVRYVQRLNVDQLLENWEKSGFPLKWETATANGN